MVLVLVLYLRSLISLWWVGVGSIFLCKSLRSSAYDIFQIPCSIWVQGAVEFVME